MEVIGSEVEGADGVEVGEGSIDIGAQKIKEM